jgi:uncharacterized membrane protein
MPTKTEKSTRSPHIVEDKTGLERLIFFSDAVFAIAITLLSLEIRLPTTQASLTDTELTNLLLQTFPKFLAYIISFLVIGLFWIGHHRKFRFIKKYDGNLLLLNLFLLMTIAFIPFPTSLLSEYGDRTATIFYALVMILASLLSAAVWWYASHKNRLIDPNLDQRQRRREAIGPLLGAGVFLLSIGLAFINENLARLAWMLVVLTQPYYSSKLQTPSVK